jgi:ribose/xylose/arabinose/galactoside ABC-type transport system permease subunit
MANITQAAQPVGQKIAVPRVLRSLFGSQEAILFLALVLLIAYTGQENSRFFSTRNMANLFGGNAYIGVAAIGMCMVIISGNIDISVGSLMVTLSMLSGAIVTYSGFPSWLPVEGVIALSWLLPVVLGALIEAVVGFLVTYLRIPAIVVTLGFLSILKGCSSWSAAGRALPGCPMGMPWRRCARWRMCRCLSLRTFSTP